MVLGSLSSVTLLYEILSKNVWKPVGPLVRVEAPIQSPFWSDQVTHNLLFSIPLSVSVQGAQISSSSPPTTIPLLVK